MEASQLPLTTHTYSKPFTMHTTSHISRSSLQSAAEDLHTHYMTISGTFSFSPCRDSFVENLQQCAGGPLLQCAALIHRGKKFPRLSLPYIDQPALNRLTGIFSQLVQIWKAHCPNAKMTIVANPTCTSITDSLLLPEHLSDSSLS